MDCDIVEVVDVDNVADIDVLLFHVSCPDPELVEIDDKCDAECSKEDIVPEPRCEITLRPAEPNVNVDIEDNERPIVFCSCTLAWATPPSVPLSPHMGTGISAVPLLAVSATAHIAAAAAVAMVSWPFDSGGSRCDGVSSSAVCFECFARGRKSVGNVRPRTDSSDPKASGLMCVPRSKRHPLSKRCRQYTK